MQYCTLYCNDDRNKQYCTYGTTWKLQNRLQELWRIHDTQFISYVAPNQPSLKNLFLSKMVVKNRESGEGISEQGNAYKNNY